MEEWCIEILSTDGLWIDFYDFLTNTTSGVNTSLPEIVMLASKDLTAAKKLPPEGFDLMITGSRA